MESEPITSELSDQDRLLLVLGYLGPLAIVSLVAARRELVKWHAKQGLALSTLAVASWIVLRSLISFAESYLWAPIGEMLWAVAWLAILALALMALVSLVRGLEGERFKLPLLGELADRL